MSLINSRSDFDNWTSVTMKLFGFLRLTNTLSSTLSMITVKLFGSGISISLCFFSISSFLLMLHAPTFRFSRIVRLCPIELVSNPYKLPNSLRLLLTILLPKYLIKMLIKEHHVDLILEYSSFHHILQHQYQHGMFSRRNTNLISISAYRNILDDILYTFCYPSHVSHFFSCFTHNP